MFSPEIGITLRAVSVNKTWRKKLGVKIVRKHGEGHGNKDFLPKAMEPMHEHYF